MKPTRLILAGPMLVTLVLQGTHFLQTEQSAMIRNGQPGAMHRRLDVLAGDWDVEMTFYIAGGTAEKPIVARSLICHREWMAETGNKHMRDVTQGTAGGNPYYRLGIL